jgi:putative transposase
MRELRLSAQLPRHRTITTKSEKGARVAENLVQRDFHADEPNRTWVTDTTYIWTSEGWLYLSVVLDLFSRMVRGWAMAASQVAPASQCACDRTAGAVND